MLRRIRRIAIGVMKECYNALSNPPIGYVLMLHRLGPMEPDRLEGIEELKVSEETLQLFIDTHRKKYEFISLEELYGRLIGASSSCHPFICITFDDGYKDNYSIGLPFFERNQIPFSVFITTDFINRKPPFNYPFLLERMIRANDSITVDGQVFRCHDRTQKNHSFRVLKELVLGLPYRSFESSFNDLFKDYLRPEYYEDLMMSWDEVRALAESPLCTIGAHTVTHCRLSNLYLQDLVKELGECKLRIAKEIGQEIEYLSYPFGWKTDLNEEVINVSRKIGYKMGFVSYGGAVRRKDTDTSRVKRVMFHEGTRRISL